MKSKRIKQVEAALPTKKSTFADHAQKFNDTQADKSDTSKLASIENTKMDWERSFPKEMPDEYYFNGVRACADWTSADCTKDSIAKVFATQLPDIDPKLRDYLQCMAHQNGYMNAGQTAFQQDLTLKSKDVFPLGCIPIVTSRQFHYISNVDGSITFLESFSVRGYRTFGNGIEDIIPENGEPLAVVVCESVVRLQNGKIQHDFVREDVYGLHKSLKRTIQAKGKTDVVEQINTQKMLVSDESTYHPCHGKSYAAVCKEVDFTNPKKDRTPQADPMRNVLIGAAVGVGVALVATAVVTAIVFSGGLAAVPVAAGAIGALVGLKGTLAAVFGIGAMVAGVSTFFGTLGGALGGAVSDLKQAYVSSRAPKPQSSESGVAKDDDGLKKKEPSTMAKLHHTLCANDVVIPECVTVASEVVVDASSTPRTERTPANEQPDPSLEDPSRHVPSSPSSR